MGSTVTDSELESAQAYREGIQEDLVCGWCGFLIDNCRCDEEDEDEEET